MTDAKIVAHETPKEMVNLFGCQVKVKTLDAWCQLIRKVTLS